jgi:superfamily I DNA/RNA helicase/mRNA-degrading endonuclease RelE of RelBE toxin-antitoxin system
MAKRELSIKPSCAAQLFGFPKQRRDSLLEKIEHLLVEPAPDGKVRKALKGHKGVYRVRVGAYRLFYTYGDGWVKLLGIRKREEKTYRTVMEPESPTAPIGPGPALPPEHQEVPLGAPEEESTTEVLADTPAEVEALPRTLDVAWLQQLHVPAEHIPTLAICTTADALLDSGVPQGVLDRVLDNLFPKAIEDTLDEPDLVVRETTLLDAWAEGDLLSFLLKLDPEQEALTRWSLDGPTLVKGGAGTGKSTVALYRVKEQLDHAPAGSKVLFVTYTRALTRVSEQLLDQLLNPEQRAHVRVCSADTILMELARQLGPTPTIASGKQARKILRELVQDFEPPSHAGFQRRLQAKALRRIPVNYLLDEFHWILSGRELGSVDAYLQTPRSGRGRPFGEKVRRSIWDLYQAFKKRLQVEGLSTWNALRSKVKHALVEGQLQAPVDLVLLDEAQDLPPVALALIANLTSDEAGIFFAADDKQTLYGRGYGWSEIDPRLAFVGRTRILRKNYRSTRQLDRASFSILGDEHAEELSDSVRDGPLPVWIRGLSREGEVQAAASAIRELTRSRRLGTGSVAVLVHTRDNGQWFAKELEKRGIPASFSDGKTLDLSAREVKVMTLYSAKGLEFPIVIVAGLWPGSWPERERFDHEAAYLEELSAHRRLLYVGLSRAMRALVLLQASDCTDPALESLVADHWEIRS